METFEIQIYSINKKKHLLKGDATVEPLIFMRNLTLMIDEHGNEGEDIDADTGKSEGDGGDNTDEIEDVGEAENKGLNCWRAHSHPQLSQ
jgi:hypothetical protein